MNEQNTADMTLHLEFIGRDSWSRPVYQNDGRLYVDVDPRKDWVPKICTKCNNEYDGEPDIPISEAINIAFSPGRDTW